MQILPLLARGCLPGAVLVAFVLARQPPPPGALTPAGFQHDKFRYRIAKPVPSFLGTDWALDNYYLDSHRDYVAKDEGIYQTTYRFDIDHDGKVDHDEKALTYDLRLQSKTHEAFIWLRTFPIP